MCDAEEQQGEDLGCCKPCDPRSGCDECAEYWHMMEVRGLWNQERGRWTDQGWASITRSF